MLAQVERSHTHSVTVLQTTQTKRYWSLGTKHPNWKNATGMPRNTSIRVHSENPATHIDTIICTQLLYMKWTCHEPSNMQAKYVRRIHPICDLHLNSHFTQHMFRHYCDWKPTRKQHKQNLQVHKKNASRQRILSLMSFSTQRQWKLALWTSFSATMNTRKT